ncbi:discoidin domain-containing protein [Campylobacter devanensis]|uniref:discoidin domain-containing protein n=1 Tax=Campylobacter devanensis TaxID=3161138 RepID=UPI000A344382|nr:discoidin domain-containing protein [Campylobacter sp. P0021]
MIKPAVEPKVVFHESDLIDIASNGICTQSSISIYSRQNDARRPILQNNTDFRDFSIHTADGPNQWWMIDLQKPQSIEYIRITNRDKYKERQKTLKFEFSIDKDSEFIEFDKTLIDWSDDLQYITIYIGCKMNIRYIRITQTAQWPLYFKYINIYQRKFPYLIVATRIDGFGSRIFALLNAMYLAFKLKSKYGFTWNSFSNSPKTIGKLDEKYIFTQDYLKKYSYTDSVIHRSIPRFNFYGSFQELEYYPTERYGFYMPNNQPLNKHFIDFDDNEYRACLNKSFYDIGFNDSIKNAIDIAKKLSDEFGEFECIHIRNGDCIDELRNYILRSDVNGRIFPLELVNILLNKLSNNKTIVLFSADNSADLICDIIKNKNIINSANLFTTKTTYKLNSIEHTAFDLVLMSKSRVIYSRKATTYSLLASYIGNTKLEYIDNLFDKNEIISLIKTSNIYYNDNKFKIAKFAYLIYIMMQNNHPDLEITVLDGYNQTGFGIFLAEYLNYLLKNSDTDKANFFIKQLNSIDINNMLNYLNPQNQNPVFIQIDGLEYISDISNNLKIFFQENKIQF